MPSVAAIAGATNLTLVTFLIPVGAILLGAAASAGNCSSGI